MTFDNLRDVLWAAFCDSCHVFCFRFFLSRNAPCGGGDSGGGDSGGGDNGGGDNGGGISRLASN